MKRILCIFSELVALLRQSEAGQPVTLLAGAGGTSIFGQRADAVRVPTHFLPPKISTEDLQVSEKKPP